MGALETSFRIFDELYRRFQYLVSPGFDASNGGLGDDVGDNADALRWAVIGIKDSDAADHGAELAGKRDGGNVAVRAGRGTTDYNGIRHRPQGHGRVFSLALRCFVDQDDESAAVMNGAGLDQRAVAEANPTLSTITSNTDKYTTGVILVTLEELEDSYFDLDAFIKDAFGQRLYRGLAKNISQGSGNFASYFSGATSGATSASPTAVTYADLLALYGSLDPAYLPNATWTMNAATRTALLGVVDTTGRPLFQPALSAPNGADALGTLLGHPVVLDQYAPNIGATNKPIAFGDFKAGYTLRNVGSFQIARDPYTYLVSKGAVAFIGYGRGGSYSTDAGTHPIKYLTMHA